MLSHNKFLPVLLAAYGSVQSVYAASVEDLSTSNFDAYMENHDLVLTGFFAQWCQVCKDVQPIYEQAARESNISNVHYTQVDCVAEESLCEKQNIGIFPTFYLFRGLDNYKIYNGKREIETFHSFMYNETLPAVRQLSKDEVESFKNEANITVVAYVAHTDENTIREYTKVAQQFRENFLFGASFDTGTAVKAGVKQPSIILYKKFDEGLALMQGEISQAYIRDFVLHASIPLIDDYNSEAMVRFHKEALPVGLVFSKNPDDHTRLVEMLRPIAEKHKGKMNFAIADPAIHGRQVETFDLREETWPALAITDSEGLRYPLKQAVLTETTASRHVSDFLLGRLEPHFRSEKTPKDTGEPVRTVVRDNFDEVVLRNDKDVLLEFYAPWCGHCKKLEPEYRELALLYSAYKDKVTIAKVDATANDIPDHPVSNFPTIRIFPAKGKKVLEFHGNRTLEDLARFVEENGSHHISVAVKPIQDSTERESGDKERNKKSEL